MSFAKEPAVLIGLAASIVVAVVGQLVGYEVISPERGIQVENLVNALVPLVTGILIRSRVTPAN